MKTLALVALGGSFGAVARYALTRAISGAVVSTYPWATLAINLTGCFFIGLFFVLFEEALIPETIRAFITVGFLGAYTTFSTYSIETIQLFKAGHLKSGMVNILASNMLGLLFVFAGFYTGKMLLKILK
jgi:CrcB protein